MGLTGTLLRFGAGRPHGLLISAPGGTGARLAVEDEMRRRGWPTAASPAAADLLVVAGEVGSGLGQAVEEAWREIPFPKARVKVSVPSEASSGLDLARRQLADLHAQRLALAKAAESRPPARANGHQMQDMEAPGGLPVANRADDRDGLKLDQLHVPLGPVLPDWPAGLVVRLTIQGDVVQHAEVETLVGAPVTGFPFWDEPWLRAGAGEFVTRGEGANRRAGAHLDSLGRLLAVAGWESAAAEARRLRDELAAARPGQDLLPRAHRLALRLRRSLPLRWLTDRIGVLPGADPRLATIGGPAAEGGDVTARWRRWLTEAIEALGKLDDDRPLSVETLEGPRGRLGGDRVPSGVLLELLPDLLRGAELAAARLTVASLDPDLDQMAFIPQPGVTSG